MGKDETSEVSRGHIEKLCSNTVLVILPLLQNTSSLWVLRYPELNLVWFVREIVTSKMSDLQTV